MTFEFIDFHRRIGRCDVEQYDNIIIFTELADNPAASVTNACEFIARQYVDTIAADIKDCIFIERYDCRSYDFEIPDLKVPNYALLTFTDSVWIPGKLTPHWVILTEKEFQDLIKNKT
jgi:hypothetical protein